MHHICRALTAYSVSLGPYLGLEPLRVHFCYQTKSNILIQSMLVQTSYLPDVPSGTVIMPCDVEDIMVSSGYPHSPLRSFGRLDLRGNLSPTISVYGGMFVDWPANPRFSRKQACASSILA